MATRPEFDREAFDADATRMWQGLDPVHPPVTTMTQMDPTRLILHIPSETFTYAGLLYAFANAKKIREGDARTGPLMLRGQETLIRKGITPATETAPGPLLCLDYEQTDADARCLTGLWEVLQGLIKDAHPTLATDKFFPVLMQDKFHPSRRHKFIKLATSRAVEEPWFFQRKSSDPESLPTPVRIQPPAFGVPFRGVPYFFVAGVSRFQALNPDGTRSAPAEVRLRIMLAAFEVTECPAVPLGMRLTRTPGESSPRAPAEKGALTSLSHSAVVADVALLPTFSPEIPPTQVDVDPDSPEDAPLTRMPTAATH